MDMDARFCRWLLDSLKEPLLFVDTDHVVRYLNQAAAAHYEQGDELLGSSIFDCHNEDSNAVIREVFAAMQGGEQERRITDNDKHRIYMRAVRDDSGTLVGYYERYEPPAPR